MKRCPVQQKRKFRDAGDASRYVRAKDGFMRLYRCPYCGWFHLSRRRKIA